MRSATLTLCHRLLLPSRVGAAHAHQGRPPPRRRVPAPRVPPPPVGRVGARRYGPEEQLDELKVALLPGLVLQAVRRHVLRAQRVAPGQFESLTNVAILPSSGYPPLVKGGGMYPPPFNTLTKPGCLRRSPRRLRTAA